MPDHYHVFLAYNDADLPVVEELARLLERAGLTIWFAHWHMIGGDLIQQTSEAALEHSATCAVFVGASGTGPWQAEQMRVAIARRVEEQDGFRVIPVLLPGAERGDRSSLPAFLVNTAWVEFRNGLGDEETFRRLVASIRNLTPGPGPHDAPFAGICPYRGLEYFDVDNAPLFFGRSARIGWQLDKLRPVSGAGSHIRFLAVIGPSGSGKSSLARAGLLAALKQGRLPGSENWPQVICRPGTNPLENLALELSKLTGNHDDPATLLHLHDTLRDDQRTLHVTVRLALRDAAPEQRVVVLVDQFEELFTSCRDERLQRALIDNLLYAATEPEGQTLVVVAMRADFYGKCAAYPALANAIADHQDLVGPLDASELREAIERPAQLAGRGFEPGLVEVLLDDVQGQPGSLPLLQFALQQIWQKSIGPMLTHQAYQQVEGVEGALQQHAEKAWARFSEAEQAICQRIFVALTNLGEGAEDTRRLATFAELAPRASDEPIVEAVLRSLTNPQARLVTTSEIATKLPGEGERRERVVELSHEALIRSWSRLRTWIDADRDAVRFQRRLAELARIWNGKGRDPGYLDRGPRLAEAEGWAQAHGEMLGELERAFLEAGLAERDREQREYEERQRRELEDAQRLAQEADARAVAESKVAVSERRRSSYLRVFLGISSVLLAMALLAAYLALQKSNESTVAAQSEAIARANADNARATADVDRTNAQTAAKNEAAARADAEQQLQLAISRGLTTQAALLKPEQWQLALLLNTASVAITPTLEARQSLLAQLQTVNHAYTTTLWGHTGMVRSVAFSADGTMLASASEDGRIILWDVATRQPLGRPLSGHTGMVWSVAFSPDGTTLASASTDNTIILWDVATRQPLGRLLTGHTYAVGSVAFSPDGKMLASASADERIILWNVATRQPLGSPLTGHTGSVGSVAFSPDGKTLASASTDNTIILWDVATRQPLGSALSGHTGRVLSVAFSPDGKMLASASEDGRIILWNVATRQPLGSPLSGHTGRVLSVAFSPDGKMLASASEDGRIILWDVATQQPLGNPLSGHTRSVGSVAFSPDGKTLASASEDGRIILWDVATRQPLGCSLSGHTGRVWSVAFSPDGKMLASASEDGRIILWDVATRQPLGSPLSGHTGSVLSVAFSADGKMLASASEDGRIILWDVATQQPLGSPLTGHTGSVWSVAFSPDGKTLASASNDGRIILWDVATQQPLGRSLSGHTGSVLSVAFSPDGTMLASASTDNTIILWDVATHQPLGSPLTGMMGSVAFSPDGTMLASASTDNTIILWDVATRQPLGSPLSGHTGMVWSVAFSPDGTMLAVASTDNTIILWDVATRQPLGSPLSGHTGRVWSVAFSPDGKTLASASEDSHILLWDVATQQPLKGHIGMVLSVAFSPDGKTLASASVDERIILWDVATRQPLGSPLTGHTRSVTSVAFSPDGKTLASASDDRSIILWDVATRQPLGSPLTGHTGRVTSVAFSADGKTLASASDDRSIILWDVATRQPLGSPLTGHGGSVLSVAFSPDGTTLASASIDSGIILWDVVTHQPLGRLLTGHTYAVRSVAFSPDGTMLASASADDSIILWDVATRQPLGRPLSGHTGSVRSVAFSPDGKMLASASDDRSIILWDVATRQPLGRPLSGHTGSVLSVAFSPHNHTLAAAGCSDPQGDSHCLAGQIFLWSDAIEEQTCQIVNRNMTWQEWQQYLPQKPYARICPAAPLDPSYLQALGTDFYTGTIDLETVTTHIQAALAANALPGEDTQAEARQLTLEAQRLAAPAFIGQVANHAKAIKGIDAESLDLYIKVKASVPELTAGADDLNSICWWGSLSGHANDVLDACNRAVDLDKNNGGILDSRGLARALTGDVSGAINDFNAYLKWAEKNPQSAQRIQWRKDWIKALSDGHPPSEVFNAAVLEQLHKDSQ